MPGPALKEKQRHPGRRCQPLPASGNPDKYYSIHAGVLSNQEVKIFPKNKRPPDKPKGPHLFCGQAYTDGRPWLAQRAGPHYFWRYSQHEYEDLFRLLGFRRRLLRAAPLPAALLSSLSSLSAALPSGGGAHRAYRSHRSHGSHRRDWRHRRNGSYRPYRPHRPHRGQRRHWPYRSGRPYGSQRPGRSYRRQRRHRTHGSHRCARRSRSYGRNRRYCAAYLCTTITLARRWGVKPAISRAFALSP